MELKDIGDPKYIALETFRKSGEGVITPVWAVAESGKLYVWTGLNSWKVKRMRAEPSRTPGSQRCARQSRERLGRGTRRHPGYAG